MDSALDMVELAEEINMRRAAKIDANQPAIVAFLRRAGATVAITSTVGSGFPDAVVGWRGRNYMIEIKDPAKPPSARKLTDDERRFFETWRGQVTIVETEADCLRLLGLAV